MKINIERELIAHNVLVFLHTLAARFMSLIFLSLVAEVNDAVHTLMNLIQPICGDINA